MAARLWRRREVGEIAQPRTLVRVLSDPDELSAAVVRAIEFEQSVAERTASRIAHYEEISGRSTLVPLARLDVSRSGTEAGAGA